MTTIRPMRPEDRAYVASTWHRAREWSAVEKSETRRGQSSRRERSALIDRLIDTQRTLVAIGPRDHIVGFICYTPLRSAPVVHFLYVRAFDRNGAKNRGNGMGRELLEHAGVKMPHNGWSHASVVATESTKIARTLAERLGVRIVVIDPREVLG